ncbi:Transmembrane 9 super member 3 [Dermatophagoides farinae]|nr:Transmembrane 9 super member 3 [Dermatophagoides farinae]
MTIKNSKHENVMLNDNIEQNLQILMNNNKRTGQKSSQQSILMRTSEYSQMNRKYFRPLSVFRRRTSLLFLSLMLLMAQIPLGASDEHEHIYEDNEEVVLWMNTVGPYHNRQETYGYFSLPFCRGPKKGISHYHETLSEAIQGVELEFSGLDIRFKVNMEKTPFCKITMTKKNYHTFEFAIKNYYSYQMYIDDLPIMGSVGYLDETDSTAVYFFTHKKFDIGYNGDQIVDVNMTSEGKVRLEIGQEIEFSYEVNWKSSSVHFEDRFDKYLDPNFFQHRIHWFSIFNSFMMVIFLVGLVTMILMRTLRKDYARYNRDEELDDMDRDLGDEYGWKQVHGDVFRPPAMPMLFSLMIGCGYHIAFVTLLVIIFAIMGDLYTSRGSILSVAIFVYAAASPVNGYFGGSLYAQFGGKHWIKQMFWSAFAIPLIVCGTAFFINFIAIYYHASRAIPFTTMLAVASICIFIILPLTLVGTVLGRNISGQSNNPCRINAVPRPIPEKKWFMEPLVIVILGGILPFGSIFIEMYFIFTSFWAYKIYYVYGFMLLVFLILAAVTSCVTIVCTYFLLNSEDYRWQWTSFMAGASTSIYVYLYSFYYFFFKTKMYGLFQTVFYFGYMALFSIALGIMCGTFGYMGTKSFARKIYSTVKID